MSEDTKILASVAGVVVLGAVGIAVISAWSLNGNDADRTVAEARTSAPSQVQATPASYVPESPVFEPPMSEFAPLEIETVEKPAFQVRPGENYIERGIETFEAREFDKAVAYFEAEGQARPSRAWTHYMLGLSLWKAGRLDESLAAMERSAELDPASIKTFVNLARIQNDRGEYVNALDAAQSALSIDPENPVALFLEGRSLRNLGNREEALESLIRSVELDPDSGYVQNLLGLTLLDVGRHAAALNAFERASELETEVAYIQNNLGMALELNGRRDEAVEAYRRAVALDAGHAKAASNLARLEPVVAPAGPEVVERDESEADTVVDRVEPAESDEVTIAEVAPSEDESERGRP